MQEPDRIPKQRRMQEVQLMPEQLVPRKRSREFQIRALVASEQIIRVRREQPRNEEKREGGDPARVPREPGKLRRRLGFALLRRDRPLLHRNVYCGMPSMDLMSAPRATPRSTGS